MSLILGARADKELIKYGEEKAFVEALVTLPDSAPFFELLNSYGIEAEEDMIVSRELSASGKNVCRINGRMDSVKLPKRCRQQNHKSSRPGHEQGSVNFVKSPLYVG